MRNLRLGFALTGFSVFSILVLRFVPGPWIDDEKFMNSTIGYVIMGLIFYVAVYFLGLPSLEFFRLPRLHAKTFIALGVTIPYLFLNMYGPTEKPISLSIAVPGIIFLLSIGFGEEMFSRAFVFGVMQKFGTVRAVLVSSLFFGLLHLNLFLGSNWDSWAAYSKVVGTFAFGILACALMITTRSIWVSVIFHALYDWSIVFEPPIPAPSDDFVWNPNFWDLLALPSFEVFMYCSSAIFLFWLNQKHAPKWLAKRRLRRKLDKLGLSRIEMNQWRALALAHEKDHYGAKP